MSNLINNEDVKKFFEEHIKILMTKNGLPSLDDLTTSVIDFYENYKIENVDTSFPDEDTLFFEYGIYDWQDGKGENFTISFIRQYIINPEIEMQIKRSQLHFVLYYDCKEFNHIEPFSIESLDYENIGSFKENSMNSEGYINAINKSFSSYDIFLIQPE